MAAEAEDSMNKEVKVLSSEDLLNNSYNFGARIPANENGAMYAIKGLFGLYDAGFSETEFFKQDAVYSKNEQRDMWEYVLNLEAFETQLLNYHYTKQNPLDLIITSSNKTVVIVQEKY